MEIIIETANVEVGDFELCSYDGCGCDSNCYDCYDRHNCDDCWSD